jgi:dipeptidyl aminopeptidase/acylaminoacyl peptidase
MKDLRNACALVALLAASCSAYSQNTPLTLAGYLDFADVGDAHISPDGKRVIYMLRTVDKINDRRQSAMWLVNADGSGARSLGKGGGVGWAPDGAGAHGRRVSRTVRRAAIELPATPAVAASLVRALPGLRGWSLRFDHEPPQKRRGFSTVSYVGVICARIAAMTELRRTGLSKRGTSR